LTLLLLDSQSNGLEFLMFCLHGHSIHVSMYRFDDGLKLIYLYRIIWDGGVLLRRDDDGKVVGVDVRSSEILKQ
jgi:hypothetical protein